MAALRRLVSVISDGRSKKKASASKVTGLFFLVAGAGWPSPLRGSVMSAGCASLGVRCSDKPDSGSLELA